MWRDYGLERHVCDAGWARRAADFDARIFAGQAWSFEAWQASLAAPSNTYIAYTAPPEGMQTHGDIVALGGISSGYEPEILTLGVAPLWRGRGIAGCLLDELLVYADADKRTEAVFLEVRAGNALAQKLYESRGFFPVGVRPGYYGGTDGVIMRRNV